MSNATGGLAQPASLATNKARGGITGHNVRYVLAFGLGGIIVAFIVVGIYFGIGI